MFASVIYWWSLADDIPALYPALDLFTAPFLANLAAVVDETLYQDESITSDQANDVTTFLQVLNVSDRQFAVTQLTRFDFDLERAISGALDNTLSRKEEETSSVEKNKLG